MQSPAPTTVSAPQIRTATTPADWHAVHRLRNEHFVAENGQEGIASLARELPTIRALGTDQDMQEMQRLRYQVYVSELGFDEPSADHAQGCLGDGLDKIGTTLGAFLKGKLVGGVRWNTASDLPASYQSQLEISRLEKKLGDKKISYTGKLLIAKGARNVDLLFSLCREIFTLALCNGVRHSVVACWDHLIPLYDKLGFTPYTSQPIFDSLYGQLTPMLLKLEDTKHLRQIRSPLMRNWGSNQLHRTPNSHTQVSSNTL